MDDTTFAKPGKKVKFNVQIVHLDGNNKGQIKRFSSSLITFGRNDKCDVVLRHAALTVSRIHAKIVLNNGRFILKSIGTNGTFLNGQCVEQAQLYSNDILKFSASGPSIQFLYEKILCENVRAPDKLPTAMEKLPYHEKSEPAYKKLRLDSNVGPRKNEAMRTYNFRASEPSILENLKSALRKIKRRK